jgi:hypothetical protein
VAKSMSIKLLTLPRSGSHLTAAILKCDPVPAIKPDFIWEDEKKIVEEIESNRNVWFHYPHRELVSWAFQNSQADKYLLLRDPRAIIASWAHYCEEPSSALNFLYCGKKLHTYPFKKRIDLITDFAKDLFFDYEKWRQSGMFTVLRYRDILFSPLSRFPYVGFRLGVIDSYKNDMTEKQIKRANKIYRELIKVW